MRTINLYSYKFYLKSIITSLLWIVPVSVFCQAYQTTIGNPYPLNEYCPGGIVNSSNELVMLNNDFDPNTGLGTLFCSKVNNFGVLTGPIQKLTQTAPAGNITARWIEKANCSGGNGYIALADDSKYIILTLLDANRNPIWVRQIGDTSLVAEAACVKVDADGNFIVVGTLYDFPNNRHSILTVKVDCNGNMLCNMVYASNLFNFKTSSVTAFATSTNSLGNYFITGSVVLANGGDTQYFLLKMTSTCGLDFLNHYDLDPIGDDIATCIQGFNQSVYISGYSTDNSSSTKNAEFLKTDLNGIAAFARNYDIPNGNEYFNHFVIVNAELLVTGRGEEMTPFQSTHSGDCMLVRIDALSGLPISNAKIYTGSGFSSVGNRIQVTPNNEIIISGNTVELISPSQSASNNLIIKTAQNGEIDTMCYHETTVSSNTLMALPSGFLASLTLGQISQFTQLQLSQSAYSINQTSCTPLTPPCDCDFVWTDTGCFSGYFTVTCNPSQNGTYTYDWDLDGGGPMPPLSSIFFNNTNASGPFSTTLPYTFPCGGGLFNVCLTVTDPSGTQCKTTNTISVSTSCCGSAVGQLACHPTDPYKYNFSIIATNPLGSSGCTYNLSSVYPLSNVVYNGNIITGCVTVTDPIPVNLGFTLNFTCTCPMSGLPITCTLPFSVATVCCKEIFVNDVVVCSEDDAEAIFFNVSNWPPLNMIYQVNWYVMPKPVSGICPVPPWGISPYVSTLTNSLSPLVLFPNGLPSDVCIYAEINLNDGPCTQLISNVANVQRCNPTKCSLPDFDYCYTGSPLLPNPITFNTTQNPPTCISTIQWFDENNVLSPGFLTFTPTTPLTMSNNSNCYEDFFYTLEVSDICGIHTCKSRIRLWRDTASIGTISSISNLSQPICRGSEVSLAFTPNCSDGPPSWTWLEKDCIGNTTPIVGTGSSLGLYLTNGLFNGVTYIVQDTNGVCPARQDTFQIEVLNSPTITNFTAIADPCAESFVTLTANVTPSTQSCSGLPFTCTYTYEWYKDGFLIGTTFNGSNAESFTYNNVLIPPSVAGIYYVIITDDCCTKNVITSWPESITPSCDPMVMGPCFICDSTSVTLMGMMVLRPKQLCLSPLSNCTFTWYDAILVGGQWVMNNIIISPPNLTVISGGHYFLESNCNGCIKKVEFNLLQCTKQPVVGPLCGLVAIEELLPIEESPLIIYPNPTTGEITVKWTNGVPPNAQLFITDIMGNILHVYTMSGLMQTFNTDINNLPSGIYVAKVLVDHKLHNVIKLIKHE